MKKFKKTLALSLAFAMGLSLVACGKDKDDEDDDKSTEPASSQDASSGDASSEDKPDESTGIEAPSTDGWDSSKKIYCPSWDDDFSKKIGVVLEAYPQYKDYVELEVYGVSGTDDDYKQNIDDALANGGDKYPSIIPADNDVAKYWSESDATMNIYDLGITDAMLSNAYDFAIQYGTYGDELKAVTWQACPGSIFYRRDIAKEVFGTDDPDAIQKELASWDKFFAAADKLKEKNYKIVSGPNEIKYAVWDTQTQPWVTVADDGSETLTLDDTVSTYLDLAKKLYDGGYTNLNDSWSEGWTASMADDGDVFCYFGCPWFIGCMGNATAGNWGAVVGPTSYHWGGTYLMVGKDTPNPELVAFLLYELTCDPEIAIEITNKYGDCCNNKEANERLVNGELASDNTALAFLGGQNPFEVWASAAEGINLSNVTYMDSVIKGYIDEASKAYNEGTYATVDDAVAYIETKMADEQGISK